MFGEGPVNLGCEKTKQIGQDCNNKGEGSTIGVAGKN